MTEIESAKRELRQRMRAQRLAHWRGLPDSHRALVFSRPPNPLLPFLGEPAIIGLYAAMPGEVPTSGYARFFGDQGTKLALPWFADREAVMQFRLWAGLEDELEIGPFGALQPGEHMALVKPDVIFVPLVAFDARLTRLGQGGGHYDRYLAANPETTAIGLAWSAQQVDQIPTETHDQPLAAIVTEHRIFAHH